MDIDIFIEGVPYAKQKVRGDVKAPPKWTDVLKDKTRGLHHVKNPCIMTVIFVFPKDKYPTDLPYGPDLDNYLKRLLDALNQTIFSEVQGHDSAVVAMIASKRKASQGEQFGARVIIQELYSNNSVSDEAIQEAHDSITNLKR
jgi:Holliday junction resolvase RusA-like endonuclease